MRGKVNRQLHRRPLPVTQALLFALQITRGMKHAVGKIPEFIHRDLKPENVLVGADKLPGTKINRLRVTDFGLTCVMESQSLRCDADDTGRREDIPRAHTIERQYGGDLAIYGTRTMAQ